MQLMKYMLSIYISTIEKYIDNNTATSLLRYIFAHHEFELADNKCKVAQKLLAELQGLHLKFNRIEMAHQPSIDVEPELPLRAVSTINFKEEPSTPKARSYSNDFISLIPNAPPTLKVSKPIPVQNRPSQPYPIVITFINSQPGSISSSPTDFQNPLKKKSVGSEGSYCTIISCIN